MRRAAAIGVLMGAIALAAPSGAGAAVTQEDRDFAAAVGAYDAAALAVTHDPAILDAVRARQQAATACLDAARSLRAHDESSAFVGAIFYTLHAIVPIEAGLVPATRRYADALRALRLRNPVLRSARAVALLNLGTVRALTAVSADFCGPLEAWHDAGLDTPIPKPIAAAIAAFRSAPDQTEERAAKLRRASVRLRATGMRLAVRERFVGVRSVLDTGALLKGDPVPAALSADVGGP